MKTIPREVQGAMVFSLAVLLAACVESTGGDGAVDSGTTSSEGTTEQSPSTSEASPADSTSLDSSGSSDEGMATGSTGETGSESTDVGTDPPSPSNDEYLVLSETASSIDAAQGVLANDGPGAAMVVEHSEPEQKGASVDVAEDGSFVYTPAPGFLGEDGFTYVPANAGGDPGPEAQVRVVVRPTEIALPEVANDGLGFIVTTDSFGVLSTAPAGDVNGDGHADVLVLKRNVAGEAPLVSVVFGRSEAAAIDFESPADDDGVWFDLPEGVSVNAARGDCDFNGDGFSDLILALSGGINPALDGLFVVFGAAADDDLDPYDLGTRGYFIDVFVNEAECIDDINDDGLDEIVVGASVSQVIFGKDDSLDQLALDSTGGDAFYVFSQSDAPIELVARLGDVNGDGTGDYAMVSSTYPNSLAGAFGRAYVLFGGLPAPGEFGDLLIDLDDVEQGLGGGYAIEFVQDFGHVRSASSIGDLDGDGLAEVVLGKQGFGVAGPGGEPSQQRIYVAYGKGDETSLSDADIVGGAAGFAIETISGNDGLSVAAGVGDLDGDGLDDLLMGAPEAGLAYVRFGAADSGLFTAEEALYEGGFSMRGGPNGRAGVRVSAVGDFNGDGRPDLGVSNDPGFGSAEHGRATIVFTPALSL